MSVNAEAMRSGAREAEERPVVSLIICTKNRGQQLRACLDRVTRLKAPFRWELILVDNGSTDDTAQVMREFLSR
ncbi:glycosyltransferase, partial [Escherichia coli]|nr:glycosyltransferase [Escherichia coli]